MASNESEPLPQCYVILERQYRPDLALKYPDEAAAKAAVDGDDDLVDALCGEDCLDLYLASEPGTCADGSPRELLIAPGASAPCAEEDSASGSTAQDPEADADQDEDSDELPAIAVFVDSRASRLAMEETVTALLATRDVAGALVDEETSLVAAAVADAFRAKGVMVAPLAPAVETGLSAGLSLAESIAALPALLVVVPAVAAADTELLDQMVEHHGLDLAPTTAPGAVVEAAQRSGRTLLVIDVPENGLVRLGKEREEETPFRYRRRIMHIGHDPAAELPSP